MTSPLGRGWHFDMSITTWLASLLTRLVSQAPVKVVPNVFVKCVERAPQVTFGLMYFRLVITNNSSILIRLTDISTAYPVKYYFCNSLYYAHNIDEALDLEKPDEIPLAVPPTKEGELVLCTAGIPETATFELRPHSRNRANPFYTLTIT